MPTVVVNELFLDKSRETRVWMSEFAAQQIEDDCDDKPKQFMKKLQMFAEGGFWNFEGEEYVQIRHEHEGAYRVRHKQSSEFRLIGFYTDEKKREFVALDGFLKRNRYTTDQWRRIQNVAKIKQDGTWKKAEQQNDSNQSTQPTAS